MRRLLMKSRWLLAITAAMALTACGTDQVDDVFQELDPPQINYLEEDEELLVEVMEDEDGMIGDSISDMDGDGEADEGEPEEKGGPVAEDETVMQELYLVDRNGFVAPQSLDIPKGDNEVKQTIEHLVQGGPVTEKLPSGFQAVLPAGTEVLEATVTEDGTAVVDFSDQFTEYSSEQELSILQSLTWSVTQLNDVNRLKIKVNGEELDAMPQRGTPVSSGYTRNHGINLEMSDEVDLVGTRPVVVYFLSQTDEQTYYVPVTRRIPDTENVYQAVVNELLNGPDMMSPLLTDFRSEVQMIDEPDLQNGTLILNFNEALLSQMEGTAVSEDVLNMLVLSLTEQKEVEKVAIEVESEGNLLVSTGETLTEPVSRPSMVNTGEY
ncbi:germination protein M [Evansella caseinilytica]|uniref:Germination protein M n=1 Tax=Evansella caseinilytica TaxID=1503961 RepID=A0A1H3UYX0_9BACI|nr:GerMN domain-containing protein [Evansella caseinilytica]SDZ67506.1 germination protein M [Evansella caseinilytica]